MRADQRVDENRPKSPIRVALVASSLALAGAEKQFVYLAQALFQSGLEICVFYLGNGGYYETVLRETGIPLRQIYTANRPLRMLVRLIKEMQAFRPHIVFISQFGDIRHGGPAGRLCGALTLGSVRADGFYEFTSHGRWTHWIARLCHGLIANSFRARENLVSCGVNSPRMEVLPNVIDLEDFDARAAAPLPWAFPSGRKIAAAIGRLHTAKRFDRFLDVLSEVRGHDASWLGVIAGAEQGARTALEEQARALGLLPDHVFFTGESDRVPALLARSDLLVLCSECEGFPNILLEAMAARLPVVTMRAGDAARIVQHGITGYVVESVDQMPDCIIRLGRSRALRQQMGEAGRERVEQEYRCEMLPERLLRLFETFAQDQDRTGLAGLLEEVLRQMNSDAPPSLCGSTFSHVE